MSYGKYTKDGFIYAVSDNGGERITEEEYTEILNAIGRKPTAPDGYDFRLTEELKWEMYEIPIAEEDIEDVS